MNFTSLTKWFSQNQNWYSEVSEKKGAFGVGIIILLKGNGVPLLAHVYLTHGPRLPRDYWDSVADFIIWFSCPV